MKRRGHTALQRTKIFLAHSGVCHLCGEKINGTKEVWELEHVIPFAMGGKDDESNLRPAHKSCHSQKTKEDVTAIAKAKRIEAKHIGAKPKHAWPSRKFNQSFKSNTKDIWAL
jgi:5-methylcytosine-specific restriction endonuclease McrA